MHLLVPALMFINADHLASDVIRANPTFSSEEISRSVAFALRAAIIFHAVLLAANLILAGALALRKKWSRWVIIALSLMSIVFSLVSWNTSEMFHTIIVVSNLLLNVLIVLLCRPQTNSFLASGSINKQPPPANPNDK